MRGRTGFLKANCLEQITSNLEIIDKMFLNRFILYAVLHKTLFQ